MSASWGARASQGRGVRRGDTQKLGVSVGRQFYTEAACGSHCGHGRGREREI